MLQSALEHYRRQQRLSAAAVVAVQEARAAERQLELVIAFQIAAARDAAAAVPLMLDEQGLSADSEIQFTPAAVAGVASDGRPLDTLLAQASNDSQLGLMVATQIQDAARAAASIGIVSRPRVDGYVRMLNPPSCSRCAILAGKFYRWNKGFDRHPKCDCRHIPSSESLAGDLTTDPQAYFDSLSPSEQDRIFTKTGAQAVRDGSDLHQVVNARRGMNTAQPRSVFELTKVGDQRQRLQAVDVYGRQTAITREGITVRGRYGKSRGDAMKVKGQRYSATKTPRLMPESIYQIAGDDRAEALRLLKLYGYVL